MKINIFKAVLNTKTQETSVKFREVFALLDAPAQMEAIDDAIKDLNDLRDKIVDQNRGVMVSR